MLTDEQIKDAREFHYEPIACGGTPSNRWKRNGETKYWVTRPQDFRIPIKFGLYGHGYITPHNVQMFHAAEDCPKGG